MTVLKIIPILAYGCFFAKFCLRLLAPRCSALLLTGVFAAYEVVVDNYIISRRLQGFTFPSLFTHIGFIILILLLFRGDAVKKIAVGVIGYAIYNLSSYLVIIPLYLAHDSSELVLTLIERSRFISAVLLLELISRKCTRFGGALSRKSSATILIPVVFVVFANELVYFAYERAHLSLLYAMIQGRKGSQSGAMTEYYFMDAAAVLLTAVLGLAVLLIVAFANNAMLESRLREQHLNSQVGYYRDLEQRSRQFAALRHDMKNHILSLQGLVSRGESNQIALYLKRMSESDAIAEPVIATGNSAVDAVLNTKYRQAVSDGIDFQCDARIPESTRADSFDLCIILGNATDNALEACRKCDSNRFISIKSGTVKSFLVLEITNSAVAGNPSEKTDKPDSEFHGMGLQNIRAVTERGGGTMEIAVEKGVFTLSVLLPI